MQKRVRDAAAAFSARWERRGGAEGISNRWLSRARKDLELFYARQELRQRQPSDGATWLRIASMTCAL